MSATSPDLPVPGMAPRTGPTAPGGLAWYYAGFWWRVLAWMIDSMVLAAVDELIGFTTGLSQIGVSTNPQSDAGPVSNIAYSSLSLSMPAVHLVGGGLTLVTVLLNLAYFSLLESSRWQATLGKLACRLRVTDEIGRRIGLGRATGRNLAKYLSALTLGIGFLMVGWTRRKQGLHDLVAGTLVLRRRPSDLMFGFQPPVA